MVGEREWACALLICSLVTCGGEPESSATGGAEGMEVPGTVARADLAAWDVRLDDPSAEAGGFQMTELEDGGWGIQTGPAGITWRSLDLAEAAPFTVRATFAEPAAPSEHREAYGIFLGGRNLQAPDQRYTYFLVRGTGEYLIKRRDGEATPTLVDWTASPAVETAGGDGVTPENTLEVRVEGGTARFFVNGIEVEALPVEEVEPYGLGGLRVNHMLDLRVTDFAFRKGGGRG